MLGKTFKGMTDEMLAWQTERFTELATSPADRSSYVVHVRPEQVVEIAFDGLQRSTRYPGGLALRFARVVRYRDDKTADEADTIETVRGAGRSVTPPVIGSCRHGCATACCTNLALDDAAAPETDGRRTAAAARRRKREADDHRRDAGALRPGAGCATRRSTRSRRRSG